MLDGTRRRRLDRRLVATGLAVAVSVCTLPITLARLTGGDDRFPSPLLAAAAPFAAAALLPAVVLALVGRPRRLAALPAALAVLHLAWLAPSLLPDAGPGTVAGARLTVLTSNVLFGEADAAELVAAVDRFDVDVLVVQELTADMVERLRAAGLERRLSHPVLEPAGGASGTGIWTRTRPQALPSLPGTTFAMPRLRLPLGDRFVTVTAAHPFPPHGDGVGRWNADMRTLHAAVAATPGPQVVAGDFNATRDHAPFRRLLDAGLGDAADGRGVAAWPGMTWPNGRWFPPVLRLDHVLVSHPVRVDDVRVLVVPGSDHRAVVARLRLG